MLNKKYKVEVFVPESHLQQIISYIRENKLSTIGNYSCCFSYVKQFSSWESNQDSHPFIGEPGKTSHQEEIKVEFYIQKKQIKKVVDNLTNIHPYENPCINVIKCF